MNDPITRSAPYEATFMCCRCGSPVVLRAQSGQWASSLILHWQTECKSLCKKCLYKEREKDMNVLGPLIAALIMVESSGNDVAIGGDGKSFGPLQITDVCREDVNRIIGLPSIPKYTRRDCFDRQSSIAMFEVYIGHYCTAARLGHEPTWQDAARIWNGGPDDWRKPSTISYWAKVQAEIERRK